MRQPGKPAKTFPQIPRAGDTLGIIAPGRVYRRDDFDAATVIVQEVIDQPIAVLGQHGPQAELRPGVPAGADGAPAVRPAEVPSLAAAPPPVDLVR